MVTNCKHKYSLYKFDVSSRRQLVHICLGMLRGVRRRKRRRKTSNNNRIHVVGTAIYSYHFSKVRIKHTIIYWRKIAKEQNPNVTTTHEVYVEKKAEIQGGFSEGIKWWTVKWVAIGGQKWGKEINSIELVNVLGRQTVNCIASPTLLPRIELFYNIFIV